jgi:hypothetical protein
MKQELDKYLCKVFPKIFAERNLPMQETAMCWGFECGDGWFNIINQLCQNIQHHIDWKNKEKEVPGILGLGYQAAQNLAVKTIDSVNDIIHKKKNEETIVGAVARTTEIGKDIMDKSFDKINKTLNSPEFKLTINPGLLSI